jgi:primosomal protein N' (replication factor Y) (superfamily II helicase)
MDFVDVIFPLNLGPLTYRCPEKLINMIEPGMIVSAPLKNRIAKGIVIGKCLSPPAEVRDIENLDSKRPLLSVNMIRLLLWMSKYYLAEQGLVLKNTLPKEVFIKVRKRKKSTGISPDHKEKPGEHISALARIGNDTVTSLRDSLKKSSYNTFLFHSPSTAYEYSLLREILAGIKNAIILVPEIFTIETLSRLLQNKFGERMCIFHGELSRGEKSEAIERVLSGSSDILIGTRTALFVPMQKVSFIAVLGEHSTSYKQENTPCYNARDVAVLRGYLEKATVLLSSISPSIESFYNCKTGKYVLITPRGAAKRPVISVVDMRYEKHLKPGLSKTVVDAAARYSKKDGQVMFVINRRGYSSLLQCADCNTSVECSHCRIPLVFHKQDMSLKCHYCGSVLTKIPDRCSRCNGYTLKLLGAGTQRIQEDIEELTGMKTLRIDSDRIKKKSELRGIIESISSKESRILIGTKLMTRHLGTAGTFSMAAVLNTDSLLNIPDFRSAEKAFQEILSVIDKIEPAGRVFIQTRMPENYLFQSLKTYDHQLFFKEELIRRKTLFYPPFSRLILIRVITERDISRELSEYIDKGETENGDFEILGPHLSRTPKGKNEYKILLKSAIREQLHAAAKSFTEAFKDSRDIRVKVDVDPMVI